MKKKKLFDSALSIQRSALSIHMVGIGGAGVSGLALLLRDMGFKVSGSDRKASGVTARLKARGIHFFLGHAASHVPRETALLAYSSAVKPSNPELREAGRRGIAILTRGQLLAEISRMQKTVTVSGSHGKTTTASMVGWILNYARKNPTVIVGGEIRNLHTNAFLGKGEYFVMETDESDGSFLHAQPLIAVVTNIDNDHLDYWGSFSKLVRAFHEHLERVPFYGRAILCQDDPVLAASVIRKFKKKPVLTYGFSWRADLRAGEIRHSPKGFHFEVNLHGKKLGEMTLRIPGRHNVLNALAALGAALSCGVDFEAAATALAKFKGIRRRIEWLGQEGGVTGLDDYGHHPTEIRATLEAVKEFFKAKRILACFQPHRYSRTRRLSGEFGKSFGVCDFVWVCPIYAASEKPMAGVNSNLVLAALRKNKIACAPLPSRVRDMIPMFKAGDVFITIGAGDVWKIGEEALRRLAA